MYPEILMVRALVIILYILIGYISFRIVSEWFKPSSISIIELAFVCILFAPVSIICTIIIVVAYNIDYKNNNMYNRKETNNTQNNL